MVDSKELLQKLEKTYKDSIRDLDDRFNKDRQIAIDFREYHREKYRKLHPESDYKEAGDYAQFYFEFYLDHAIDQNAAAVRALIHLYCAVKETLLNDLK